VPVEEVAAADRARRAARTSDWLAGLDHPA
jgi:hypothetical protein